MQIVCTTVTSHDEDIPFIIYSNTSIFKVAIRIAIGGKLIFTIWREYLYIILITNCNMNIPFIINCYIICISFSMNGLNKRAILFKHLNSIITVIGYQNLPFTICCHTIRIRELAFSIAPTAKLTNKPTSGS